MAGWNRRCPATGAGTVASSEPATDAASPYGTVVYLFGRYFAGNADMLTRAGFKTLTPMNGISPFTAVGDADPEMLHFADAERSNDRVRADVQKDFAARLAGSGADYLVVDNTAALLWHREVNSRTYVVLPKEPTDLTDYLSGEDDPDAPAQTYRVSRDGLNDDLRRAYDAFVDACRQVFDPTRIILVRSHAARFWMSSSGRIEPTDVNRADARLLYELDDYFLERTGCRVSDATLSCFPGTKQWHAGGHAMQDALELDLVRLCSPGGRSDTAGCRRPAASVKTAADHVLGAVRADRDVDEKWLEKYFAGGNASYDDLLALAYLDQRDPTAHAQAVRRCVRVAMAHGDSLPVTETRLRFQRSVDALQQWKPYRPRLPLRISYRAQVSIRCGQYVVRFGRSGSIEHVALSQIADPGTAGIAGVGAADDLTLRTVLDAIASWPTYFARGRTGTTAAPVLVVPDAGTLVDSCYWIDWARVLQSERVVIRTEGSPRPSHLPRSRTDLSFVFDPAVRICTVGGGLMDQVTHIAMFDEICSSIGADYYLDDFRYTWWRSHNGFEASRLAPQIERRRMTRQISPALMESFRSEITRPRLLPWLFSQSRFWYENGLPEATVVTRKYFNAERLVELGTDFSVLVYPSENNLAGLMKDPPTPVSFFTTQQRIKIAAQSADAIRHVFSYHHLEAAGLPPEVAELAETLRASRHVALHVRRGDYLNSHFDTGGWHSRQDHYIAAVEHLIDKEFGSSDFDVAVFSDDLEFVDAHRADYGLDRVTGDVRFVRGNMHYRSIFDSYLMALCPVIVGSVGFFAATTSLLADPPSAFIRARPEGVRVEWHRDGDVVPAD